ncbi:MAG: LamG domain-containing protein [Gammaproteobacteria bacterium]|nr:LamG domain-containing protein [Gammaproteobacteria bacterium]
MPLVLRRDWWRITVFNSNVAVDCSSNGNSGVAVGAVSLVPGVLGKAAKFGGYQNLGYVSIPASSSLAFGNDFTISYWVRFDDFAGEDAYARFVPYATQIAVAKSHDSVGLFSYVAPGPERPVAGFIDYGTGAGVDTPITAEIGRWLHVTVTHRSRPNRLRLYVNGELQQVVENRRYDFSRASAEPLYLGVQSPRFGERTYRYPLAGALDEVRLYNRELTAVEIYLTVLSDRYGIIG